MALTFVDAVSIAESGEAEIRVMLAADLGCNLAWGLVGEVMHLVRTVTDRGRALTLVHSVRGADAESGRALLNNALSKTAAGLVTDTEVEAIRGRIVARQSELTSINPSASAPTRTRRRRTYRRSLAQGRQASSAEAAVELHEGRFDHEHRHHHHDQSHDPMERPS